MTFTITATVGRTVASATWTDGRLSGHEGLIQALRSYAEASEGDRLGPVGGPYTRTRHLASGLSTVFLCLAFLGRDSVEFSGDVPEPPEVPEGAVI